MSSENLMKTLRNNMEHSIMGVSIHTKTYGPNSHEMEKKIFL